MLQKDNCKTRRETFKFCDLVPLILEIWWLSAVAPRYITVTVYHNIVVHRAWLWDAQDAGPCLNIKTVFPSSMGILMLKIRRSRDRLIFNMGIPILERRHLYIEADPRSHNELTKDTQCLALMGGPCSVFCDYFRKKYCVIKMYDSILNNAELSHTVCSGDQRDTSPT